LVGLPEVKALLVSLRNSVEVQRRRAHLGVREDRVLHMLFLGNPGTGKTKVAKLVARMMRALGVLKTGQLIEVTRKDLIGPHHGETAQLTSDAVKKALGGVLFIDEAYALKHEGASDSGGQEAVNTLVKEIEDHQNEVVVILAGYQREMTAFLSSNSGLQSRFPHVFNFTDYSPDEVWHIGGRGGELCV
ncbi:P-loop containing nucleoside triphosphate hydrolase protein, partial [Pavlovales sp. CCMP2436]